eukprot:jgi/Picre1/29472/NNA_004860.t1
MGDEDERKRKRGNGGGQSRDQKNMDGKDIVKLPRKGKYRQRAHSNPLLDVHFDVPTKPSDVDWSTYFPELYAQAAEKQQPPPRRFCGCRVRFWGYDDKVSRRVP